MIARVLQIVVGIAGLCALALGLSIWIANTNLMSIHMLIGILVTLGLLMGSSLVLVVVRNVVVVILAQGALVAGGVGVSMVFTRLLHDSLPSGVRAGAASGAGALSSMAFVLFALLFGVVSQHVGVFHAGWMVVGVALLASVLLVRVAMDRDFKGSTTADTPSSNCGFCQN